MNIQEMLIKKDIWKTNPFAISWKNKLKQNKKPVLRDEDEICRGCGIPCYHILCDGCDKANDEYEQARSDGLVD